MREPDNELGLSWLPLFDFFGEIFENHGYMPKLFSGIFLRTTVTNRKSQWFSRVNRRWTGSCMYGWLFDFSNICKNCGYIYTRNRVFDFAENRE